MYTGFGYTEFGFEYFLYFFLPDQFAEDVICKKLKAVNYEEIYYDCAEEI